MVVIKLKAGLGNQLFQYAFGLAMAKHYNKELKFDIRLFKQKKYTSYKHHNRIFKLNYFNTHVEEPTWFEYLKLDKLSKILNYGYFNENGIIPYQEEALNQKGDVIYFDGFWQSTKYFKNVEDQIRSDFKFKLVSQRVV